MGVPVTAAMVEPLPPMNLECRAGGLPIRLLAAAAIRARAAVLDRAREPVGAPALAPTSAVIEPTGAGTPATLVFDRFPLLAAAVDGALARNRREIEAIEAIEAKPRPHGREHGLEWAHQERLIEDERLRQVAALLRALAPREAAVLALAAERSA